MRAATDGQRNGAAKVWSLPTQHTPAALQARWPELARQLERIGAVDHPHVVALWEWGLVEGHGALWVVMERLAPGDPTPANDVEAMVPSAAALFHGLSRAHAAGVLHGDLKPANLVWTKDRGPVMVDFSVLGPDPAPGSPRWMAPECLAGQPASAAADVYSLGQCLLERCTGRRAFAVVGAGPGRLIDLLAHKRAADPLDPGDSWPAAFRQAIRRATDADPGRRPTAAELADLLGNP